MTMTHLQPLIVHRYRDGTALGRALATRIADQIQEALGAGRRFVLGCPGGRTPTTTYAALADELSARGLDLRGLVIAMMDDYVVPHGGGWQAVDGDAHYSCRRFAHTEIRMVLNASIDPDRAIPEANVWLPDPADPADYEARLRQAGGIDFFILASGAGDGHVAFNPPGTARDSRTRVVELAEQTRRDNLSTFPEFAGLHEVPTHGVTVGIATITEATTGAMIVIGPDKRDAFAHLTSGDDYDPNWPATVYHLIDGAALYADEDAASPAERAL
ncbi:MAG: 6-phosphogluconolactonase [Actinomycetales bacterium]|nr:6-phosphogluconolactonase [Actinomycetales bacterium]